MTGKIPAHERVVGAERRKGIVPQGCGRAQGRPQNEHVVAPAKRGRIEFTGAGKAGNGHGVLPLLWVLMPGLSDAHGSDTRPFSRDHSPGTTRLCYFGILISLQT